MFDGSKKDSEAARELWALPRRDFIVFGSVAMAGAVTSSVTAGTLRAVAMPSAGNVLSIGYTDVAIRSRDKAADRAPRLVAAKSLRLADAGFSRGARVVVHGLSRPEGMRAPVSIRLSAFAPAATPMPFLAWEHSVSQHGRINTSRSLSFVAALDDDGTLPFAIERHELAMVQSRRLGELLSFARNSSAPAALPDLASLEQSGSVCRLSSGDCGDVRLRAGTYFVALRQSYGDRQPDWSSLVLDGATLSRDKHPVDFEYITLSVDYVA